MSPRRFSLVLICATLFFASCAGQPVRNLASDAALIKQGETSSEEVLRLIGPPDQRQVKNNQETWTYHEQETSKLKTAPVIGRLFNPRKEESLVLVIRDNIVFSARYGSLAYNQPDWDKDFDWQGGKK